MSCTQRDGSNICSASSVAENSLVTIRLVIQHHISEDLNILMCTDINTDYSEHQLCGKVILPSVL
jgi:hypothetical protein